MELCKQSLLNLQLFTEPLTKNFASIEIQFRRINDVVAELKEQNQAFQNFKNSVEKLIENNQLAIQQGPKPRISKQQITQQNQDKAQINSKVIENVPDEIKLSTQNILQNELSDKNNLQSISLISQQQIISSSVLDDTSNLPHMSKAPSIAVNLKDSNSHSRKETSQSGKRQVPVESSQSSRIPQNKAVSQQMQHLKQRLQELEANQFIVRQQIQDLENQNEKFRKLLGIKKSVIKEKTVPEGNSSKSKKLLTSFSKKSIKSKANFEAQTQKSIMEDENQNNNDEDGNDLGCFKQLKDDMEKIREYLNGKMKAIDTNFAEVNIKINGIERSLDILERTDSSLKEDIQSLEKTAHETKLNMTELHQKSAQLTKSRYRKNHLNTSSNQLNEEGKNNEIDIEQKISNLLDEMERLKDEYYEMLFGKGESDDKQKEPDPQMLERRKKLAQKLNSSSSVPDQKMRKDLSYCKRDLKKLRQEFDYLLNGVNTGTNEIKTLIIKPNENKEDWKSLSTKINKLKQELQSQIKQLQGKITANNELTVVLNEFEVGIEECKILLKKKLDITDFDKTTKRIENRLNNFIRQTFEKEGYTNEQDAILAKQPWFCLSCDVELKTYSGKINKQSPVHANNGEKFVGKKVNPESHMVRRNENGRLPSIAI